MTLAASFFVSTEIHQKEVELADGEKHTLYFKELPHVEVRQFQLNELSEDHDVRVLSMARLIAASLCEADGKPAVTVEQATQLKASVVSKLMQVITDVNAAAQKKR
jgi:hypothetical protein